ncbi:MAG TPA: hypothetical protein VKR06_15735 [Ktedonosporobacter sp.]|nr:hypothetical protein [Ktedonosporobacter sp.]
MDVSTTMTSTQLLLIWTLFGFLLSWLVVFTILALRPATQRQDESDELLESTHLGAIAPAPSRLHVIATPPPIAPIGQEAANEAGTVRAR